MTSTSVGDILSKFEFMATFVTRRDEKSIEQGKTKRIRKAWRIVSVEPSASGLHSEVGISVIERKESVGGRLEP